MTNGKILKQLRKSRDRLYVIEQHLKVALSKCDLVERAFSREMTTVQKLEAELAGQEAATG